MERILVAVKQVATLDDEFELNAGGTDVDPDYLSHELNEWDDYALEEALRIAERAAEGEVEVIALTVGPEQAEEVLRTCLAKGAGRAIRVWDVQLEQADALVVAAIIAAVAEREQARLVFTGVQSADQGSASTGPAVAALLGWPWAAVVAGLDYEAGASSARVRRELEGGLEQAVDIDCPALLAIQVGINSPRYASLRGIRLAASKPLETLDIQALDLDEAALMARSGARVRRMYTPPRGQAEMIGGDVSEQAARIAELVKAAAGTAG